ncbi:MAG: response regulator transcription factor [Acidimicrobiales bacterium]
MLRYTSAPERLDEAVAGLGDARRVFARATGHLARSQEDLRPVQASETDRLVLEAFLRARNRAKGPLVALTDRTMMANVSASELLQSRDRRILWDWARGFMNRASASSAKITLSNGVAVAARCEPVAHMGHLVGAVLHLSLDDPKRDRASDRTATGQKDEGSPVPLDPYLLTGWTELTDAERTVADLVAQGLTNKQTAKRILRSHHTVDSHLRSLYRKLGVSSRVELARLLWEHYELLSAS